MAKDIHWWLFHQGFTEITVAQVIFSIMTAILFIQSGLDKVLNWKGEKDYYTDHFKNSPLKGTVSILMPIITVSELCAGFFSAIGIFTLLLAHNLDFGLIGMFFATLSIIQLFFGQRLAKDYAGAATLIPYFFLTFFGLFLYLLEID